MTEGTTKPKLVLFPLQIGDIEPIRIDFEAFVPPSMARSPRYFGGKPSGFDSRTKYKLDDDSDTGAVILTVKAQFKPEVPSADDEEAGAPDVRERDEAKQEAPYRLEVSIGGSFSFEPDRVAREQVESWCKGASFFILSPYVRQLVWDITAKSGFGPVVMPLVHVPVLKESDSEPH